MSEKPRFADISDISGSIAIVHSRIVENSRADFSNWGPIQIVQGINQAMSQMPENRTGVVLGSGKNTAIWKTKGWLTLDIDPYYSPDFVADANHLQSVFSRNSLDFLFAEYLTFDNSCERGVSSVRLLAQSNQLLKTNGYLTIKTSHQENYTSFLPNRYKYVLWMSKCGFNTIIEINADNPSNVTYYGQKIFNYTF